MEGHVHLMLSCSPNIAPSKVVQLIKGGSSEMIEEYFPYLKNNIGDNIFGEQDTL